MSRIYIAGSGGMLGEAFYKIFNKCNDLLCSDIDTNEEWIQYLDFRDQDAYRTSVFDYNPNWLFHIGAYTDLEYCELHSEDTYLTNTESVKYAVTIANELKIPILYISTAGIFDGNKASYDDSDTANPLGHYANSKYLGEQYIINNAKNYLICRAGWMMGGGPKKDKKFIQKIMYQIKNGTKELHIVNDKLGTPTYTHDFAANVNLLINKCERGLFNMVCDGLTSRLDVARELLSLLKMDSKINIVEVESKYFTKEYFATRPDCERLINKRLDDKNLNIMRDWKVSLKEYLKVYYNNYL